MFHFLQIGGSAESFAIAREVSALEGVRLTTSFAGRTQRRRAIKGAERVGSFGGTEGLIAYCLHNGVHGLIDATHPFAARMKANAHACAQRLDLPLFALARPPWMPEKGDQWTQVASSQEAADILPKSSKPVLLAMGRQEIAPFAKRHDLRLVIRLIEEVTPFPHPNHEILVARGPFALEAEQALFARYGFGALVCKNSGGDFARAKLLAARRLRVPVLMLERPKPPKGPVYTSVASLVEQVSALCRAEGQERACVP